MLNYFRFIKQLLKIRTNVALSLIYVMSLALLSSCGGGGGGLDSGETSANTDNAGSSQLVIEKAAPVPVLNGKSTFAGVYVYNSGDTAVNNIRYSVVANKHTSSLQLVASTPCQNIAAYSSCLLGFTTPALESGQGGSSLIEAHYADKLSSQLVNYNYVNTNNYQGVNFSGDITLFGTNDYATVYAFAGKSQAFQHVRFQTMDQSVGINNGLINGYSNIAANQVVTLELKSSLNVTSNQVKIMSFTDDNNRMNLQEKRSVLSENELQVNEPLTVTITPQTLANLVLSNPTIMGESIESVDITVFNNGNRTASSLNFTSSNPSVIGISSANLNPCATTLAANSSCKLHIQLNDKYNNGSVNLSLAYNNTESNVQATQVVYYQNSTKLPMVALTPSVATTSQYVNSYSSVPFTVTNSGGSALNNLSFIVRSGMATYLPQITSNSCGNSIAPASTCQIMVLLTSDKITDSGNYYLLLQGSATTSSATPLNYSFVSRAVNASVTTDPSAVSITSVTPQSGSIANQSTAISLSFNQAMLSISLNTSTIQLYKESGNNPPVSLSLQGVSNSNQTVTFYVVGGSLTANTRYKIVINPSQIFSSNNTVMDGTSTSQVVAYFDTNNITAPVVSAFTPANGTTSTPNANISINFSKAMDLASVTTGGNISLQTAAGDVVSGTSIDYNSSTFQATINTPTLSSNTTYKVVLNESQILDTSGNNISPASAVTLTTFTTDTSNAPILVSASPSNGSTNVNANSSISLTFSQSMNTGTLTTANISLVKASNSSSVTLGTPTYSNNNTTVTFTPSSSLESGAGYYINLKQDNITDSNNNVMGNGTATVSTFMATAGAKGFLLGSNFATIISYDLSTQQGASVRLPINFNNYAGAAIASNGNMLVSGWSQWSKTMGGQIYYSSNSGTNWSAAYGLTQTTFSMTFAGSIICISNGVCLVSASNSSGSHLINRSEDNGQTWYQATIDDTGAVSALGTNPQYEILGGNCSTSVCIFTGSNGIIIRSSNTLQSGSNLGNFWMSRTLGTGKLEDASCVANQCVVVGDGGVVYYSADAGVNWSAKSSGVSVNLNGISCNGSGLCVAVGASNTLIKSNDYGQSWSVISGLPAYSGDYKSVAYTGSGFIAVGTAGKILASNATASTWTDQTSSVTNDLNRISCNGASCIIGAISEKEKVGPILISSNSGASWSNKGLPVTAAYSSINGMYCNASSVCMATAGNSAVNRSTDNGLTWASIPAGGIAGMVAIDCFGVNCALVQSGSESKNIRISTNTGSTWSDTPNILNIGAIYKAVKCISATECIAVGASGVVVRSSSTGTWSVVSTGLPTTVTLNGLSCNIGTTPGSVCIAVGSSGTLIRSTDRGVSWTVISSGSSLISTDFSAKAIACDLNTCLAAGQMGSADASIYRSVDGGLTWTLVNVSSGFFGAGASLNAVKCLAGTCLVSGTSGGRIFKSTDGGVSWVSLGKFFNGNQYNAITLWY